MWPGRYQALASTALLWEERLGKQILLRVLEQEIPLTFQTKLLQRLLRENKQRARQRKTSMLLAPGAENLQWKLS